MTDIPQIVREVISKKPDDEMFSDLDATLAWAAKNKGSATAIAETGFCRGGRNTWLYATHNPNLKAAVAWYGPVKGATSEIQPKVVIDVADKLKCPLLGLYGDKDTGIAVADVKEAEAKAKAAGKTVEIVVYPDAPHGFHADYRPSYRQADAEDGWKRMLAWFKRTAWRQASAAHSARRRARRHLLRLQGERPPRARRCRAAAGTGAQRPQLRRAPDRRGRRAAGVRAACAMSHATSRTTRWRISTSTWRSGRRRCSLPAAACTGAPPPTRRAMRCWRSAVPRTPAPSPRASR